MYTLCSQCKFCILTHLVNLKFPIWRKEHGTYLFFFSVSKCSQTKVAFNKQTLRLTRILLYSIAKGEILPELPQNWWTVNPVTAWLRPAYVPPTRNLRPCGKENYRENCKPHTVKTYWTLFSFKNNAKQSNVAEDETFWKRLRKISLLTLHP